MTFVNWINLCIMGIIIIGGFVSRIYYKRKLRDLDGFMGIASKETKSDEK